MHKFLSEPDASWMVSFIPIERRMLIRWCWNAEAEAFATEGRISRSRSIATE